MSSTRTQSGHDPASQPLSPSHRSDWGRQLPPAGSRAPRRRPASPMHLPSAGAVCGQPGSGDRPLPCHPQSALQPEAPFEQGGWIRTLALLRDPCAASRSLPGQGQTLTRLVGSASTWPPGSPGACLSAARTRQPPHSQAHPGRQWPTERSAPPGGLRKPPSGWAGAKRGQGTGPAGAGAGDPSMGLYRPLLSQRAETPEKWLQWVSLGHGTRSSFYKLIRPAPRTVLSGREASRAHTKGPGAPSQQVLGMTFCSQTFEGSSQRVSSTGCGCAWR